MMALFAGPLRAEIIELDDALREERAKHASDLMRLRAQLRVERDLHRKEIDNLVERHDKEELDWQLERAHLQGRAEATRQDAEMYRALIGPHAWHFGGQVECDERLYDLWEARVSNPLAHARMLFPQGKEPK